MGTKAELKNIAVDRLSRGEFQPRTYFDETALQELAESIKQQGLIEPLVVRALGDDFEIIAGERRWRAAQLASLADVPCLVNDYTDEQAMAVTLIENIQREDLNVIEEALGYQRLIDEFFFQHDDIGKMVGKSRSHVTNTLRLLNLSDEVKIALERQQLSMGQAKVLVGLDKTLQKKILANTLKNDWSARRVEQEVKRLKTIKLSHKGDRDVLRLEALIGEQVGSKAEIEQDDGNGGWLKIKFFDNDTLAGLLDKMGVSYEGID
jgi:ParB family transcriptional regulator, chromosome partitioning protein